MTVFASLADLACHAGISRQALEKAVINIVRGRTRAWRGASLVVRTVRGRGGRSGIRYEVLVASLPLDLQESFKAAQRAAPETLPAPAEGHSAEREWWYRLLRPAFVHPKHSSERGAALSHILERPLTDWRGKPVRPSRRTLERKLAKLDLHGIGGLAPRRRKDKGTTKVVISAVWDAAVPFDEAEKQYIASRLRDYIRGLYKDGASTTVLRTLAGEKLKLLTFSAGCTVTSDLARVFTVPRRFIEAEASFRNVAVFKKDRKTYEDARPRTHRTRDGLKPMQIVVGDVHHLDIVMHREDGTTVWPKAISWLDQATNRIRMDIIALAPNEGVRNADVIRSFVNMTQDLIWGMPRTLYLDNGSEYKWPDFVDDAMKLVDRKLMDHLDYVDNGRSSQIVRARPYNAAAKAIEGIFGVLEQTYFRTIPGWAGGDRTNKKTAKVGRPTEPFPGNLDDLRAIIGGHLVAYEASPQRGSLKNRSPRAMYLTALEAGWQRIDAKANELRSVFAISETRVVRQGATSYGDRPWTCPELETYLGNRVTIRIPKFEEPAVLPLLDENGELFGFAEPATLYGVLDKAGARKASQIAQTHRSAIRELDRSAPNIDTTVEVMAYAASLPPLPAAPIAGTISVNAEIAAGLSEPSEERSDRQRQKAVRKHEKRSADIAFLHKRLIGGRS